EDLRSSHPRGVRDQEAPPAWRHSGGGAETREDGQPGVPSPRLEEVPSWSSGDPVHARWYVHRERKSPPLKREGRSRSEAEQVLQGLWVQGSPGGCVSR